MYAHEDREAGGEVVMASGRNGEESVEELRVSDLPARELAQIARFRRRHGR